MAKPSIRVILDDGTNTYVTVVPIDHPHPTAAIVAAGQAFAWFVSTIEKDRDTLESRLRAAFEAE